MKLTGTILHALGTSCLLLAGLAWPTAAAGASPGQCTPWKKQVVASGYGILENLAFDGRGDMLLSQQSLTGPGGSLQRLTADGERSVAVPDVNGPGGIVVKRETAYFTTGNTAGSGLTNRRDGTIEELDLDTGATSTVARKLQMPNGLAQLPNGDFVVSKDIGSGGSTLVSADGSHKEPSLRRDALALDPAGIHTRSTPPASWEPSPD